MLYYNFCDYEGFEAYLGLEKRDNSVVVRKNKILLVHLESPALLKYCEEHNDYTLLHIYNTADLQRKVFEAIIKSRENDEKLPHKVELVGETYHSSKYETDEFRGLYEDLDEHSIRYINVECNRVPKMRIGRFIRELILETEMGKLLSPCVVDWITEDVFAQRWCTHTYGYTSDMGLFVNDEFRRIYDSSYCKGNSDSRTTDKDRISFYYSLVKVKAAHITGKIGSIVARAILFTDATNQDGERQRLPERQYSSENDNMLKRLLVDKPIQEDYINGYKVTSASCRQADALVGIDGYSLSDRKFEIGYNPEETDTFSYQDSFKWYGYSRSRTYNYENPETPYNLGTIDLNPYDDIDEDGSPWDEYHQYDCDETTFCYLHGNTINVDPKNLDDFLWISSTGEYRHKDDCVCCDNCGGNLLEGDAEHSEVTEEHYCCKECMERARDTFKQKSRRYPEYDDKWYENYTNITCIHIWDESEGIHEDRSINVDTLCRLLKNEDAWEFGRDVFDEVNPSTNPPYSYKLKKEMSHKYTIVEEAV